ncbi:MAG: membrane protein insertase YidC [Pirellulales bacterium]
MEKRWVVFFVLAASVLALNIFVMRWLAPPPGQQRAAQQRQAAEKAAEKAKHPPGQVAPEKKGAPEKKVPGEKPPEGDPRAAAAAAKPRVAAAPAPKQPRQWRTLGSLDETSPYRFLVTVTNRGAAVERIELATTRFSDLDDRSGYLGHLAAIDAAGGTGVKVRVVGAGTPADKAGLRAGDVIAGVDGGEIAGAAALNTRLERSKPGDSLRLTVLRGGKRQELVAVLARQPLAVIEPEGSDPPSFLTTLESIDDRKIAKDASELPRVNMRTGNWKILPPDPARPDQVAFEWLLGDEGVRIVKTYRLPRLKPGEEQNVHAPAYHLDLSIKVENVGDEDRAIAYRLDGPNGLPTQGWWYAYSSKISHGWDSAGIRDFVIATRPEGYFDYRQVNATKIADGKGPFIWDKDPLIYAGVDAQYFAVMLIPQQDDPADVRFARVMPIRAGPVPKDPHKKKLVNISTRMISRAETLKPGAELEHEFRVFAGPKRPRLLAQYAKPYGLSELVYYGWFGFVSRPMLVVLHFFYSIVGNYGIAIIMLTVLVRSCMFPLSRKQALGAQKMQELQPEMKRLAEKHKGNVEQRTKAQQELFRKHNYNPLAGCWPALIQLPIFLGLYRSLSVDVELYQAPLISHAIRWCSNLAAPDMFWYWEAFLPGFLAGETGWLGPYLNILPLVTVALFLWQQKMFMPPPADEQAALQMKIMQYMMIFMGVLFFKVASGLCIYFIASSIWGIAERKLLPKAKLPPQTPTAQKPTARPSAGTETNGAAGSKKKKKQQRGRR